MPDLQALLAEIDRLDQEATKAPWYGVMDDLTDVVQIFHDQEQRLHVADIGDKTLERVWQDAEFIALARTALPQLAAVIRRLRECAQTLTEDNNDASDYASGIHEAVECFEHIITDALGADDD